MIRSASSFVQHQTGIEKVARTVWKKDFGRYKGLVYDTKKYRVQNLEPKKNCTKIVDGRMVMSGPIHLLATLLKENFGVRIIAAPYLTESNTIGILLDDQPHQLMQWVCQGSRLHLDPGVALNVKVLFSDCASDHISYWLIVHPLAFSEVVLWLKKEGMTMTVLEHAMMEVIHKHIEDTCGHNYSWIVEQRHGDIVSVPVGHAHAVYNMAGASVKVARDFVAHGHLYECMISYMYLWRHETDLCSTQDFLRVAPIICKEALSLLGLKCDCD